MKKIPLICHYINRDVKNITQILKCIVYSLNVFCITLDETTESVKIITTRDCNSIIMIIHAIAYETTKRHKTDKMFFLYLFSDCFLVTHSHEKTKLYLFAFTYLLCSLKMFYKICLHPLGVTILFIINMSHTKNTKDMKRQHNVCHFLCLASTSAIVLKKMHSTNVWSITANES